MTSMPFGIDYVIGFLFEGEIMLFSIAIILLSALLVSFLFKKIKVPTLIGMMIIGIVFSYFNLIDESILNISGELRKIALIIILLKAGLSLDFRVLKKVGRPAILMCFLPATFEIIAFTLLGPTMLGVTYLEGAIIGSVMGAVSPAVVVPKMSNLIDNKYGTDKGIPQMIIAGSSADDVFCIVLFTAFIALENSQNSGFNALSLLQIPTSIVLGILLGIVVGFACSFLFKKVHMRDTIKLIILLAISFLLVTLESLLSNQIVGVSGLLAIMAMGITIFALRDKVAERLVRKTGKLWVVAEIFLFVLVGASVKINSALSAGYMAIIMIIIGLGARTLGTLLCLVKTKLNIKEKFFCVISEIPKATVQAAIGGTLLGVAGINQEFANYVLAISVIAIIICAPLGAFGIDFSYKKLLVQESGFSREAK